MPLVQRFMKFVAGSGILLDARLLELYPPFMPMRIKVLEITENWRIVRILLPIMPFAQSGWRHVWRLSGPLADPIAALACARVFPGYSVWTRAINRVLRHAGIPTSRCGLRLRRNRNARLGWARKRGPRPPHSNMALSARTVCAVRNPQYGCYRRAGSSARPPTGLAEKWNRAGE